MKAIFDKGIMWTGIEKILVQCIGLAQGMTLARLLSPGDFGLAAMLDIFLGVGASLAESGLCTAYVVYGANARKVFAWNVGLAVAIYVVLALAAPAIAAFYGHPILKPLLWLMGAGIVLNAACVVGNARLQRERRFGEFSGINVASCLFAFAVAVLLAFAGMGVWTIAWMGIAGAALRIVVFSAKRILVSRDAPDDGSFGKMLRYGWKLTLSGLIHTIYLNAYQLVVGKVFSPVAVGFFTRGQRLAVLPVEVVNDSVGRIALPDLAGGHVSARRYLTANALILWPVVAATFFFADWIVGFVLGENWLGCVPYLKILLVGVLFTPMTNISLQYIRAKGRSDLVLVTDAIKKPIQFALLAGGVWLVVTRGLQDGVVALCWVKVASDVVEAAADFFVAWRLRCNTERLMYGIIKVRDLPCSAELRRRHEARELDGFLSGKAIAVVGNGPSEIGKGLGDEIDAHDVVIRINNYRIEGFEKDYGRRVDVWMKGGAGDVEHEIRDATIRAVLYTDDIMDEGMLFRFSRFPEKELQDHIVDYLDSTERAPLIKEIGSRPSSGAFIVNRLRRVEGVSVDLYGFAFLEDSPRTSNDGFEHYSKDVSADYSKEMIAIGNHNIEREVEWFKRHFSGRRLILQ